MIFNVVNADDWLETWFMSKRKKMSRLNYNENLKFPEIYSIVCIFLFADFSIWPIRGKFV